MDARKFKEKTPGRVPRPAVAETTAALEAAEQRPVDLPALRDQLSNLVCTAAKEMVQTTIEHAKQGQYQAMKYLFELVGLFPATAIGDTPEEDSLARMLLSRIGIGDDTAREDGERIP